MSISKYTYDAAGRLTEKTDRNGRVTTYTYDAAGRLTSESWLDSSNNAVNTFTYTYDLLGNLLTVSDGVSSYVYTYDTMNRLDSMSFTFDGQTALFDYAYDLAGRQTQSALTLNNVADRTINIEYDYLGRAISAELTGNALNDILAEFDYNAVGALTNVNRYEWDDTDDLYELIAKSNIQYNARNQITNITHADASNVAIAAHSYSFSPDGNITQYTNSIDGTVTYTNDFLGQLIGADYSNLSIHDESYQYDLNGNRELVTNANGDLVVYSTGTNNELTSDGAYTYAYDAEGNRISKTNAAGSERELYSWDYRNRLSSVTKQEYNATTQEWETTQVVEYAYDYNNVLIRKVLDADGDGVSDSKTLFLPENYQTAIQLDDADLSDSTYETVSHRYLWTPGQQDKLLADVTPTETLWTLTDHLGTVRDIIQNTSSGLVVPAHIIYDAYGNVLSCKDANGTDIESPVIFCFTGKYFDADTQLQNNVNRWYDAFAGRWLSTDPIGFNGNDTNLYRYSRNQLMSDINNSFVFDDNNLVDDLQAFEILSLYYKIRLITAFYNLRSNHYDLNSQNGIQESSLRMHIENLNKDLSYNEYYKRKFYESMGSLSWRNYSDSNFIDNTYIPQIGDPNIGVGFNPQNNSNESKPQNFLDLNNHNNFEPKYDDVTRRILTKAYQIMVSQQSLMAEGYIDDLKNDYYTNRYRLNKWIWENDENISPLSVLYPDFSFKNYEKTFDRYDNNCLTNFEIRRWDLKPGYNKGFGFGSNIYLRLHRTDIQIYMNFYYQPEMAPYDLWFYHYNGHSEQFHGNLDIKVIW